MGVTTVLGTILFLALLPSPVQALTVPGNGVTLAWDRSPDSSVTGYRIYYGAASGNYTNSIVVGNVTTNAVEGLTSGVTYFFAIIAYDASGLESGFSNETSYTVPTGLPTVQLRLASNGQTVLTVKGLSGHTYEIEATQGLMRWTTIGTVTLGASGSVDFADTNAASFSKRFYRTTGLPTVQLRMASNGQGVLTVRGQIGHTYEIQTSEDLKTWTATDTATVGASGSVEFVDTNAASFSKRFYRTRDTQP